MNDGGVNSMICVRSNGKRRGRPAVVQHTQEITLAGQQRRRRAVFHETLDAHGIAFAAHADRGFGDHGVADRTGVGERFVREIEQVVDQQLIVCFEVHQVAARRPAGFRVPMRVGDERCVGLCRVAVVSADFGFDVVGEFEGGLVAGG